MQNSASVGGTLAVTGAGGVETTILSTSGAATLNSAAITNNATVGGTLTVTGTTTTNGLNNTGTFVNTGDFAATATNEAMTRGAMLAVTQEGVSILSTADGESYNNALLMNATGPAQLLGNFEVRGINGEAGGSLTVTGTTTLTGALTANGGITTTTLNTSGAVSVGGTLNMNDNKITNVANGTAAGDAVNFGQLQETRKLLSGGIASSAAMANIPLVDTTKKFAVGVGLGGYDGQSALAVGGSYRVNPMTVIRGSVAGGSASKTAVGVGVGFSW